MADELDCRIDQPVLDPKHMVEPGPSLVDAVEMDQDSRSEAERPMLDAVAEKAVFERLHVLE